MRLSLNKNIRSFQIADSSAICLDSSVVNTSVCNTLNAGLILVSFFFVKTRARARFRVRVRPGVTLIRYSIQKVQNNDNINNLQ